MLIAPPFTLKIILVCLMPYVDTSLEEARISQCVSQLRGPVWLPLQAGGEGNQGQPGLYSRSQASTVLELRHHLRYTAGLSVGSHPQSSRPLGWPPALFDLSANPVPSGTKPPVSQHPSIGKADIL